MGRPSDLHHDRLSELEERAVAVVRDLFAELRAMADRLGYTEARQNHADADLADLMAERAGVPT